MLQAIRSRATSFVVKILFGLLIVTFGLWGIGDIFRDRGVDTTVATVGDRTITVDQVNQSVQSDLARLRSLFGGSIDAAQAKQLGVVDQALQRLVSSDLVQLEIGRMGLAVGDEAVRDAIMANPGFHDKAGAFDRNLYAQVLAANNMTEPQFEALQRDDLLRAQLTGALTDGLTPPKALVDTLYRARAERRVADTITLPPAAAGTIPAPSEDQIAAFYHAHEDSFRAPERRSFKVATLRLDEVAAGIDVPDDQLKQEFQSHPDEFDTPEQRQLQQMLLPDEAAAKAAQAQLVAGKDFAAVAKDVAKIDDPGALDLGFVARTDLPPELADAAFALKEGEVSAPVKSTFGWHILRLVAVKPAQEQSFDQVKDKLKQQIANDHAGDRIAELANNIDDALAAGTSFDDIVQKFGLKVASASNVDLDGKTPDGKAAADLPKDPAAILHTAFGTDAGQTSALEELGDDGYYVVQVASVTPAATRPLADVHDAAAKGWQDEARQQALQTLADAIAAEVKAGKSLKDIAAEHHLQLATTPPLERSGGDQKAVPPSLVAKLFDAKQGEAVTDASGDSAIVAELAAIEPADPAKDASGVKQIADQLGTTLQTDMLGEFDQALHRNFPVTVDQASLDRLL